MFLISKRSIQALSLMTLDARRSHLSDELDEFSPSSLYTRSHLR